MRTIASGLRLASAAVLVIGLAGCGAGGDVPRGKSPAMCRGKGRRPGWERAYGISGHRPVHLRLGRTATYVVLP